jgi:predicted branched-subunit amino acid permease
MFHHNTFLYVGRYIFFITILLLQFCVNSINFLFGLSMPPKLLDILPLRQYFVLDFVFYLLWQRNFC